MTHCLVSQTLKEATIIPGQNVLSEDDVHQNPKLSTKIRNWPALTIFLHFRPVQSQTYEDDVHQLRNFRCSRLPFMSTSQSMTVARCRASLRANRRPRPPPPPVMSATSPARDLGGNGRMYLQAATRMCVRHCPRKDSRPDADR